MSDKVILILGTDEHARCVQGYLAAAAHRDFRTVCFDSRGPWNCCGRGDDPEIFDKDSGVRLSADTVAAVYWRDYPGVHCVSEKQDEALKNRISYFESWLRWLEFCRVPMFNNFTAWRMHASKPYQNAIIYRAVKGCDVLQMPELHYEPELVNYRQVLKGVQGGVYTKQYPGEWPAGVMFGMQRRISGDTFRVYLTHNQSVTFQVSASTLDYREDVNCISTWVPTLPSEVQNDLRCLLEELDWEWCGCDVMVDPTDNSWWVLDINPSPMFLGFDDANRVVRMLGDEILDLAYNRIGKRGPYARGIKSAGVQGGVGEDIRPE